MSEAVGDLLVEMDGISKDFPGVHALRDTHFELRPLDKTMAMIRGASLDESRFLAGRRVREAV